MPGTCSRKVCTLQSSAGQRIRRTRTRTRTRRPSTGTSAAVRSRYSCTRAVSSPHAGQGTAPSRVLARTQISSPASSTSSMTSADNPENTVLTSSIASIMTDRDTPTHSATTENATEPLKLQSLAIDLACCDDFAGEGDEVGDGWVAWWLPPCEVDGDVRGVGEREVGHSGVRVEAGGGGASDSYGASGCDRGQPVVCVGDGDEVQRDGLVGEVGEGEAGPPGEC